MLSQWLPALWGGEDKQPQWASEQELQRFVGLLITVMNNASTVLMQRPEAFTAQFNVSSVDESVVVVEEWCTGYMKGVALGNWPQLPDEQDTWLNTIALHGLDEHNHVLAGMTLEEHQQTVSDIEPAARAPIGWHSAHHHNPCAQKKQGATTPAPAAAVKNTRNAAYTESIPQLRGLAHRQRSRPRGRSTPFDRMPRLRTALDTAPRFGEFIEEIYLRDHARSLADLARALNVSPALYTCGLSHKRLIVN